MFQLYNHHQTHHHFTSLHFTSLRFTSVSCPLNIFVKMCLMMAVRPNMLH